MEYHTAESRESRGVEEAGCKIYSGAPTVSQTTGLMMIIIIMVMDSKGQRTSEDWQRTTSSSGGTQPRIQQNAVFAR